MKSQYKSSFLFSYLKDHRGYFLLQLSLIIIYSIIFLLYKMESEPLLYSVLSVVTVSFIYFIFDYKHYKAAYTRLEYILKEEAFNPSNTSRLLPSTYETLILSKMKEQKEIISRYKREEEENVQYFTLWTSQMEASLEAIRLLLEDRHYEDKKPELKMELLSVQKYVERVLSYLNLQREHLALDVKKQKIEPLVRRVIRELTPIFVHKKIQIIIGQLEGEVVTDAKWCEFIIKQLLSSALKYTKQGNIQIMMRGSILRIQDTGVGIAPSDLSGILEKKENMGLYLCEGVCHKLGHKLTIDSTLNVGTTVWIDFDYETW